MPFDPARDAITPAQVRRAERQHGQRSTLARRGGEPRHCGPDAAEAEKCSPPRCIFTRRPIQDTPIIDPWHAVAGPMP